MSRHRVLALWGLSVVGFNIAPVAQSSPPPSLHAVVGTTGALVATLGTPCHNTTLCLGGVNCVPIPTSLPPLNTGTTGGWGGPTGSCGTKPCWIIFRCPCGPPLATKACL